MSSDKGSWSNQDIFWDELEERNIKRKIILPDDDIDFQSEIDKDGSIYNGRSHSPLEVDLKLSGIVLAKAARPHECGSLKKMSLKQEQRQAIEAHLNVFCDSTKCTFVIFRNTENQGQCYPIIVRQN